MELIPALIAWLFTFGFIVGSGVGALACYLILTEAAKKDPN